MTILVTLLYSCEGDIFIRYHFTGLSVENAQNMGELPAVSIGDSIPKEAYVLRMNLFPVETERTGRYLDTESPPFNANPIDSIFIYSDKEFNDTLPVGSLLNDLFLIYNGNYMNTSDLNKLEITNVYSGRFNEEPVPKYADLLLMIPPDSTQYFRFYVRIRLNDGTMFLDTTDQVKLY